MLDEQNMAHDSRNMDAEDLCTPGKFQQPPKRKKCYVYLTPEQLDKVDTYQNLKGFSFSEACSLLIDSAVNTELRQHFVLGKAMDLFKTDKKGSISA